MSDAPVTRPDLDALIHDIIEDGSWSGADELEVMLVAKLGAALAAERARADQAEQRIADALSCLRASSVPLGMTEVMFQDRLITEARRALSVAPTAEQGS